MNASRTPIARPRDGNRILAVALGVSLGVHAVLLSIQRQMPTPSFSPADQTLNVQLVARATGSRAAASPSSPPAAEPASLEMAPRAGGVGKTPPGRNTRIQRSSQVEHPHESQTRVHAPGHGTHEAVSRETPGPSPVIGKPVRDTATEADATPAREGNPVASTPPQPAAEQAGSSPSSRLLAHIRLELARHFTYPWIARRRGWQGTVVLGFELLPDGRIEHIEVRKSSGHRILDLAARRALTRVGRVRLDAWRPATAQPLELPVEYRLIDG